MAQISVTNADIVNQIKNDAAFRQQFVANTSKTLTDMGYNVNEHTINGIVNKQLAALNHPNLPQSMSTAVIITVM
jgi:1,2-phenylacetyl-CoA epoxidase catalytic subunit